MLLDAEGLGDAVKVFLCFFIFLLFIGLVVVDIVAVVVAVAVDVVDVDVVTNRQKNTVSNDKQQQEI